ncbi:hypothetical protein DNTS_015757, partial [Danionella cerebrum]
DQHKQSDKQHTLLNHYLLLTQSPVMTRDVRGKEGAGKIYELVNKNSDRYEGVSDVSRKLISCYDDGLLQLPRSTYEHTAGNEEAFNKGRSHASVGYTCLRHFVPTADATSLMYISLSTRREAGVRETDIDSYYSEERFQKLSGEDPERCEEEEEEETLVLTREHETEREEIRSRLHLYDGGGGEKQQRRRIKEDYSGTKIHYLLEKSESSEGIIPPLPKAAFPVFDKQDYTSQRHQGLTDGGEDINHNGKNCLFTVPIIPGNEMSIELTKSCSAWRTALHSATIRSRRSSRVQDESAMRAAPLMMLSRRSSKDGLKRASLNKWVALAECDRLFVKDGVMRELCIEHNLLLTLRGSTKGSEEDRECDKQQTARIEMVNTLQQHRSLSHICTHTKCPIHHSNSLGAQREPSRAAKEQLACFDGFIPAERGGNGPRDLPNGSSGSACAHLQHREHPCMSRGANGVRELLMRIKRGETAGCDTQQALTAGVCHSQDYVEDPSVYKCTHIKLIECSSQLSDASVPMLLISGRGGLSRAGDASDGLLDLFEDIVSVGTCSSHIRVAQIGLGSSVEHGWSPVDEERNDEIFELRNQIEEACSTKTIQEFGPREKVTDTQTVNGALPKEACEKALCFSSPTGFIQDTFPPQETQTKQKPSKTEQAVYAAAAVLASIRFEFSLHRKHWLPDDSVPHTSLHGIMRPRVNPMLGNINDREHGCLIPSYPFCSAHFQVYSSVERDFSTHVKFHTQRFPSGTLSGFIYIQQTSSESFKINQAHHHHIRRVAEEENTAMRKKERELAHWSNEDFSKGREEEMPDAGNTRFSAVTYKEEVHPFERCSAFSDHRDGIAQRSAKNLNTLQEKCICNAHDVLHPQQGLWFNAANTSSLNSKALRFRSKEKSLRPVGSLSEEALFHTLFLFLNGLQETLLLLLECFTHHFRLSQHTFPCITKGYGRKPNSVQTVISAISPKQRAKIEKLNLEYCVCEHSNPFRHQDPHKHTANLLQTHILLYKHRPTREEDEKDENSSSHKEEQESQKCHTSTRLFLTHKSQRQMLHIGGKNITIRVAYIDLTFNDDSRVLEQNTSDETRWCCLFRSEGLSNQARNARLSAAPCQIMTPPTESPATLTRQVLSLRAPLLLNSDPRRGCLVRMRRGRGQWDYVNETSLTVPVMLSGEEVYSISDYWLFIQCSVRLKTAKRQQHYHQCPSDGDTLHSRLGDFSINPPLDGAVPSAANVFLQKSVAGHAEAPGDREVYVMFVHPSLPAVHIQELTCCCSEHPESTHLFRILSTFRGTNADREHSSIYSSIRDLKRRKRKKSNWRKTRNRKKMKRKRTRKKNKRVMNRKKVKEGKRKKSKRRKTRNRKKDEEKKDEEEE